ncbi:MAG: hypothetical protein QME78_18310, partial [Thermodesulfobacteriota bacterium]|nr:hypothetical protein [Thermodesulfobacteriota bacterium]
WILILSSMFSISPKVGLSFTKFSFAQIANFVFLPHNHDKQFMRDQKILMAGNYRFYPLVAGSLLVYILITFYHANVAAKPVDNVKLGVLNE